MVKIQFRYPRIKVGLYDECAICKKPPIPFYAQILHITKHETSLSCQFCKNCYLNYIGFRKSSLDCVMCNANVEVADRFLIHTHDSLWIYFCKQCFEEHSGFEIDNEN
jgi:hypothetical protein